MIKLKTDKQNKKRIQISRCIYCGSKNKLTDEHVFPFALGGNIILVKACCESCREISSKCERNPLHDNWSEVRACLDYPSRKQSLSKRFPLQVTLKDGTEKILYLTKDETLGVAQFLDLAKPGFFEPKLYMGGSRCTGIFNYGFGIDVSNFAKKYDIKSFSFITEHKNNSFEIMLAKIAYCLTVATWGVDCLQDNFVLPAILLQRDDIGKWVGCDHKGEIIPLIGKQLGANVGKVFGCRPNNSKETVVLVRLKFFANADTPEYIIVVGILNDNCIKQNVIK